MSCQVRAAIEELQKVQFSYTSTLLYDEIIVLHFSQSKVDEHKPAFNYIGVNPRWYHSLF